ncbi:uncharacterized protein EI90DRAFT_3043440, partial [Cantharellus anzutake]|uniref:uncharacterized protein n=1 Tax=Cantharellus anzutake TaxID=1750568 RepID=UPI001908B808
ENPLGPFETLIISCIISTPVYDVTISHYVAAAASIMVTILTTIIKIHTPGGKQTTLAIGGVALAIKNAVVFRRLR